MEESKENDEIVSKIQSERELSRIDEESAQWEKSSYIQSEDEQLENYPIDENSSNISDFNQSINDEQLEELKENDEIVSEIQSQRQLTRIDQQSSQLEELSYIKLEKHSQYEKLKQNEKIFMINNNKNRIKTKSKYEELKDNDEIVSEIQSQRQLTRIDQQSSQLEESSYRHLEEQSKYEEFKKNEQIVMIDNNKKPINTIYEKKNNSLENSRGRTLSQVKKIHTRGSHSQIKLENDRMIRYSYAHGKARCHSKQSQGKHSLKISLSKEEFRALKQDQALKEEVNDIKTLKQLDSMIEKAKNNIKKN